MAEQRNPRGAGRKPTGAVTVNARISVWEEDLEAFEALPNKALFVRDAISEKLGRNQMKIMATTEGKNFDDHQITKSGNRRLYSVDGEVFAVATNPGFGGNGADYLDSQTRYFCLDGVWERDECTVIVDEIALEAMLD
jgi:hypothetical protein